MGLPMHYDATSNSVRVRHDGLELRGARVDCRDIPGHAADSLWCWGRSLGAKRLLENVAHVRLKESDRVAARCCNSTAWAAVSRCTTTGWSRTAMRELTGTHLSSFNDHRILMSLAVAASRATGPSTITYPHAYRVSYPQFLDAMQARSACRCRPSIHRRMRSAGRSPRC